MTAKAQSKPPLPPDAESEIMEQLSANMKISSEEIADILEKHGVSGDVDALQKAYRKRLGQRLMSSFRDESGKREVLATHGGEYVVVECCSDQQKLKAIRRNIQSQMNGLDDSAAKVRCRVSVLNRVSTILKGTKPKRGEAK
jgi:methionine synthase I (cobalamin-dependent)